MKKSLLKIAGFVLASGLVLFTTQCDSKEEAKAGTAKEQTEKAENDETLPNYRYVDLDSVLSVYNLAKDYNEEMLRLQTNFENTARQREASIQGLAGQIQQKIQNNVYLSEASYNEDQKKITQMQSSAQNELAKMQANMQNAALEAQKIVNDSIDSFIKDYNAKFGYDAILFKAATLYINPKLDITQDVIEGLNARYNKVKK